MGNLRREYPILSEGEPGTTLVPSGCNYVESGEALWELLWSHVPVPCIDGALKIAEAKLRGGDVAKLLEAAKQRAQEAPPCKPKPCPEPKAEMVEYVLLERANDECFLISPDTVGRAPWDKGTIRGKYLTRAHLSGSGDSLPVVLQRISDADGKYLGGMPLPPKAEKTYPVLKRPYSILHVNGFDDEWTHVCSQCGNRFRNGDPRICSGCKSHLKGEIPWQPHPSNEGY